MSVSSRDTRAIYDNRPLAEGHPDIEAYELHAKAAHREAHPDPAVARSVDGILTCLGRAIRIAERPKKALVVGCGPFPTTCERLVELGWDCLGLEPVEEFAASAREYLERPESICIGSAEDMPLPSESRSLVIMESVLEHVDSPLKAVAEAYRVLAPSGALYVSTTNRLQATNSEYTVRFFQWLPRLVRESQIHQHLHFEPSLARFTSRPAVHWFTYAGLCDLGRTAGFYRFYSRLDLLSAQDPSFSHSALRRAALERIQLNPWLRSLALTQKGGNIFMLKRSA
jgi:SAM-dependent methyltransferase